MPAQVADSSHTCHSILNVALFLHSLDRLPEISSHVLPMSPDLSIMPPSTMHVSCVQCVGIYRRASCAMPSSDVSGRTPSGAAPSLVFSWCHVRSDNGMQLRMCAMRVRLAPRPLTGWKGPVFMPFASCFLTCCCRVSLGASSVNL